MAFFCERTGARVVAPGLSVDVDPTNGVPVFDDSDLARAAESAALTVLRAERLADEEASPSLPATERARLAAKKVIGEHGKGSAAKPEPVERSEGAKAEPSDRPTGGRRPAPKNDPKPDADKAQD
jgi:hypothetical protein